MAEHRRGDALRMTSTAAPVRRVHLRLLPWRPRWRTRRVEPPDEAFEALDLFDDLLGMVIALVALLLLAPFVLVAVVGLALLSLEVVAVLALAPLLLLGRLCHLRPWVLVVTHTDGAQRTVEVTGLAAARRRRDELLTVRVRPAGRPSPAA